MDNLTKSVVVLLVLAIVILYAVGSLSSYAVLIASLVVGGFAGYMSGGKSEDEETVNG